MPSPSGPTFYIDESIFSLKLIEGLQRAGVDLKIAGTDIPSGASDETWLQACGENGWLALTRDQRIRYRKLEKEALKEFGVGAFTFTGGQATGATLSLSVLTALPGMMAAAKSTPKPFLFVFGVAGHLRKIEL